MPVTPEHGPEDFIRVPESRCLNCGYRMNAIGTSDGSTARPDPDAVVVCMRCGAVMKLDDRLKLRGMTDDEITALVADRKWMDEIARLVGRVHFLKHSKG